MIWRVQYGAFGYGLPEWDETKEKFVEAGSLKLALEEAAKHCPTDSGYFAAHAHVTSSFDASELAKLHVEDRM